MSPPTRAFLADVVARLAAAGVPIRVAGGWAEEILGLRPPGPHGDVDLLCPAEALPALERFLASGGVLEIAAKRLSHKRAFERDGVLVEVFLAREEAGRRVTDVFDGRYVHVWPADAFDHPPVEGLPVVGPAALASYRERHGEVARAGAAFLAARAARLARIALTSGEEARFGADLARVLEFVDVLDEVDVEGIEPLLHPFPLEAPLRSDLEDDGLPAEEALRQAPDRSGDHFRVPRVLERGR